MKIAILGATSQIARDFVEISTKGNEEHIFGLYARRPDTVKEWADRLKLSNIESIHDFGSFSQAHHYDAIINFVGAGNPAVTQSMGASILDITHEFDSLAINYLKTHPTTRYIFLSSGAAYGSDFSQPATENTPCRFDINHLQDQDWYGVAKFHAECRHRALSELPIVDIRVFSYFSHSQDLNARFLLSDILRAIQSQQVLKTSAENIVRDICGPDEIAELINGILRSDPTNACVDCYTQGPVDKFTLLNAIKNKFELKFEKIEAFQTINPTGSKINYYSKSISASRQFGYNPKRNSLEVIIDISNNIISAK